MEQIKKYLNNLNLSAENIDMHYLDLNNRIPEKCVDFVMYNKLYFSV